MGKIYLVRHGMSKLNNSGIIFGQLDPDLNEKGIKDAKRAREFFSQIDYDEIYVSPLKRTKETAKIINRKNLEISYVEEIKELNFGLYEGLSYKEIEKKYPDLVKEQSKDWKNFNYGNGESLNELLERVKNFYNSLDKNKNIIIVSHWGVINTLLSYLTCESVDAYWKFSPEYGKVAIIENSYNNEIIRGMNLGWIY